jgi:hypothetical protein
MRILTRAEMASVTPLPDPEDIEAENRRQHLYAMANAVGKLVPDGWKVEPDVRDGPALLFTHEASLEVFHILISVSETMGRGLDNVALQVLRRFVARLTEQVLESEREGHGDK